MQCVWHCYKMSHWKGELKFKFVHNTMNINLNQIAINIYNKYLIKYELENFTREQ